MVRDFLDDYSAPGADEPADTSHCMVVQRPARTSEELEEMECAYLADPVSKLPVPFRTGEIDAKGRGELLPLGKDESERLAEIGFTEDEWKVLNEYTLPEK